MVVDKMMSIVGGMVVVRTGVSDVIVGRELREELTVTRVTGHERLIGQDTCVANFRQLSGVPEPSSLVSCGGVGGQHRHHQGDQHRDVGHLTMTRMTNHETEIDNAVATSNGH